MILDDEDEDDEGDDDVDDEEVIYQPGFMDGQSIERTLLGPTDTIPQMTTTGRQTLSGAGVLQTMSNFPMTFTDTITIATLHGAYQILGQ